MSEDDIKRINRFVNLQTPTANKKMIKFILIFLIGFFGFFYATNISPNSPGHILASHWMISAPCCLCLVILGIYLYKTLEKRQINIFLFEGCVGVYITIEFLALGYLIGTYLAIMNPINILIMVFMEIPVACLLLIYRIKQLKPKGIPKKVIKNFYPISIVLSLVLVLSPIVNSLFNNSGKRKSDVIGAIVAFLLGYVFSIFITFFLNYFVARKYKGVVNLYDKNGNIEKVHKHHSKS